MEMNHDEQLLRAMKNLHSWLWVWMLNKEPKSELNLAQIEVFGELREELGDTIEILENYSHEKLAF